VGLLSVCTAGCSGGGSKVTVDWVSWCITDVKGGYRASRVISEGASERRLSISMSNGAAGSKEREYPGVGCRTGFL
jgi:hypothetical protein